MKLVITATENKLDSDVDPRFGRCKYFLVYNTETEDFEAVENQAALQGHGAGIQAGQVVGDLEPDAIITGNLGPNAYRVLSQLGLKVYQAEGSVKNAIENFRAEKLKPLGVTVPGHTMPKLTAKKSKTIAVAADNDQVSAHFGRCPVFTLFEIEDNTIVNKQELANPGHKQGYLPEFFKEKGVDVVIAGGAGPMAVDMFKSFGIEIVVGVSGKVDDVVKDYMKDKLEQGESKCSPGEGKGYGVEKEEGDNSE